MKKMFDFSKLYPILNVIKGALLGNQTTSKRSFIPTKNHYINKLLPEILTKSIFSKSRSSKLFRSIVVPFNVTATNLVGNDLKSNYLNSGTSVQCKFL